MLQQQATKYMLRQNETVFWRLLHKCAVSPIYRSDALRHYADSLRGAPEIPKNLHLVILFYSVKIQ